MKRANVKSFQATEKNLKRLNKIKKRGKLTEVVNTALDDFYQKKGKV